MTGEGVVAEFYECFNCMKVFPSAGLEVEKCRLCGSTNLGAVSAQRFTDSFKAGVYYNIDPTTGKRKKKRSR